MEFEFSRQIFENTQISDLLKIRLVGAELFHAFGRTDRHDEANSHFSQFCERVQKALSSNELVSVCYNS
jgi:hypothetical protein